MASPKAAPAAKHRLPEIDSTALRAEYARDSARLLRHRIDLAALLFLLFVGLATLVEVWAHPERRTVGLWLYGLEVLACILAMAAVRIPGFRARSAVIAGVLGALLACLMNAYFAEVGLSPQLQAMGLVCLMTAFAVLLPIGWRWQAWVSLSALASFVIASLGRTAPLDFAYTLISVVTGATTSILGAFFLDRYRYEAFARAALLEELSVVSQEEARISGALARVGATLSASMGRSDVFEQVNKLAVEILGCDFSSTFVLDEAVDGYRLTANVGSRPEVIAELQSFAFPLGSLPLFAIFSPGELVEIQDAAQQSLIPPEVMLRFETASALYVPIWRGSEVIGVLVNGYLERTDPFSSMQKRIALGIGNATAIALENERLVADLQAASRLKSEFVSTMSHELRTPLNVITGYAEMLTDPHMGPLSTRQLDLVQRVNRNASALLELVDATLDLGRLESGRDTLAIEPVDLGTLFASLEQELEALAAAGDVSIEWLRTGQAHDVLRTDRGKLKMILKNLVGNAIKFSPRGRVTVWAAAAEGWLVLEVSDTGVGIAAEHLSAIFEMFRQVDASRPGVGLGLHITKRLAERLGGTVRVRSAPGKGSTFTVSLPAACEEALAERGPVRSAASAPRLTRKRAN